MSSFTAELPITAPTSQLRCDRTSVKWSGVDADTLPMFIAEMDYTVDEAIQQAMIDQISRSDLGYAGDISELAHAISDFAQARWGWCPDLQYFFAAPDVSFGVKAALRHFLPADARVALCTPSYPSFFGYLADLNVECVEVPFAVSDQGTHLDIDALERAFAGVGQPRVHALVLSNPHNPHGIVHSREHLEALATIAAQHGTLIISDEIHAPLTHPDATFIPFSPIAAAAGTLSVSATSASKGWNIAGTKCAVVYAPPETAPDSFREYLTVSLNGSASILGRTASTVAFRDCVPWLDAAIARVRKNAETLAELLPVQLPGAVYTVPNASYLAWIDLRDAGLGEVPAETIAREARVIVSDGRTFGENGHGCIRLNLGCSEEVLREAIARIAAVANRAV